MPGIEYQCLSCKAQFASRETHICPNASPSANQHEDNWRHRAENMRCQTCMWYVSKNEKLGRCRFNAPTIKGWPAMHPTDWCGQHKLDENKI